MQLLFRDKVKNGFWLEEITLRNWYVFYDLSLEINEGLIPDYYNVTYKYLLKELLNF